MVTATLPVAPTRSISLLSRTPSKAGVPSVQAVEVTILVTPMPSSIARSKAALSPSLWLAIAPVTSSMTEPAGFGSVSAAADPANRNSIASTRAPRANGERDFGIPVSCLTWRNWECGSRPR